MAPVNRTGNPNVQRAGPGGLDKDKAGNTFVSIRGTESMRDAQVDADATLIPAPWAGPGVNVHEGLSDRQGRRRLHRPQPRRRRRHARGAARDERRAAAARHEPHEGLPDRQPAGGRRGVRRRVQPEAGADESPGELQHRLRGRLARRGDAGSAAVGRLPPHREPGPARRRRGPLHPHRFPLRPRGGQHGCRLDGRRARPRQPQHRGTAGRRAEGLHEDGLAAADRAGAGRAAARCGRPLPARSPRARSRCPWRRCRASSSTCRASTCAAPGCPCSRSSSKSTATCGRSSAAASWEAATPIPSRARPDAVARTASA